MAYYVQKVLTREIVVCDRDLAAAKDAALSLAKATGHEYRVNNEAGGNVVTFRPAVDFAAADASTMVERVDGIAFDGAGYVGAI